MNIDLKGKRAIVTGSTAGIGFAIARGLAESGAEVVVNGRSEKSVEAAKKKLGGKASGIVADLGTAAGVDEFLAKAGVPIFSSTISASSSRSHLPKSPTKTGFGFSKLM